MRGVKDEVQNCFVNVDRVVLDFSILFYLAFILLALSVGVLLAYVCNKTPTVDFVLCIRGENVIEQFIRVIEEV